MKIFKLLIIAILALATSQQAKAEGYVGGSLGLIATQNITNIKGNENLNYPDAPNNSDPTSALLTNAKYSDADLRAQVMAGIKAGYYFENKPFFGLEGEFFYSRSRFKQQNVSITHPGIVAAIGQSSFTETQLPADINMYTLAANAMFRSPKWHNITPYVGGGPALYFVDIHGTGFSGIIPALNQPGSPGPEVNQNSVTAGLNLKAGGEYNVTKNWALGLEYRYNWAPLRVDNFRSASDLAGDFQSHSLELTVVRHFNIM